MKRLVLAFLLLSVAGASATTYSVDNCVTVGSDSNNGTSTATPWLTVAKVNASSFSPGDTVQFRRTCTWREQLIPPSSGSAGSVITFGAYGSGAKPILNGNSIISSGSWTLNSGSIYQAPMSWGPFGWEAFEDNTILLKAGSLVAMTAGTFFESGTTLYVWTFDGSSPAGHTVEVARFSGQNSGLIAISNKSYITIDSLDIKNSNWIGVYLRTASHVTVQNSSFEYNYWNAVSEDEQAGAGDTWLYPNSDHVNILNNTFSNNGQSRLTTNHSQEGVAVQGLGWQTCTISGNVVDLNLGEGLVVMGGADSCTVSSNQVTNTRFASIYVLSGPRGGDVTNSVVQYNYVANVPNAAPAYVIAPEGSTGDNIDGVTFSYNVANCNNSGAYYALRFGGAGGTGLWQNIKVYGNTLVCPYGIDIINSGHSGPGNDFENNIIRSTSFQTFLNADTATSNYTIGYEDIFSATSASILWNGTSYTLAAFVAAFPTWFTNSIQADPKFTNSAGGDFTLLLSSPAINAGANLGATYQLGLNPVGSFPWTTLNQNSFGAGWELGAFVYSGSPAPPSAPTGLTVTIH